MGILDDAIREHLELKRQHGADEDVVERLEKEAFGPPARPGDPEFDTSEAQLVDPTSSSTEAPAPEAEAAATEVEQEAPPAPETGEREEAQSDAVFDAEESDADWLASLEDVVEAPPVEEEPAPEAPQEPAAQAPAPAEPATEQAPAETAEEEDLGLPSTRPEEDEEEDLTPAERARIEHPDLGDTIAHEAVPEPTSAEAPPEAPESSIFDQDADEEFGDLDLELDVDEPTGSAPATEAPAEREAEPESTTDDFESGTDDFEVDEEEEDRLEDEDEDLLEETPDFLQDAPEGERLWFEQGAPKDFDFDDDDED